MKISKTILELNAYCAMLKHYRKHDSDMRKNCSIKITMLEMWTQFLKHCRDCRSKNVYKIVCTKRFVSISYTICPVRRVLVTIECGEGDLMYIGANV